MNKEEAKRVLQAYRADLDPEENSELKEALRCAENDPELQDFLEREKSFDRAFSQKLKEFNPPQGLLARILENAPEEAYASASRTIVEKGNGREIVWWQQPVTWSIAACMMALLAIGYLLIRDVAPGVGEKYAIENNLEQLIQAAADHSSHHTEHMDYLDEDVSALHNFLLKEKAPYPQELPRALSQLVGVGCESFAWNDHQVGVICLKGDKLYTLYVANRKDFPKLRDYRTPYLRQVRNHGTAAWTTKKQLFILTVKGNTEELSPFL